MVRPSDPLERLYARSEPDCQLIYYDEDIAGTVTIHRRGEDYLLMKISGTSEVPTYYGALQNFRLLGHLPALLHPAPKDALSIAFGAGIALGTLPVGLDRYDYLGNPELEPEGNVQVDLGTKGTYKRVSFRVSGFYSRLREYVSARLDTLVASRSPGVLGVKRYYNIRSAAKIGGELSGGMKLSEAITLGTSLAYVSGRDGVTEEPLPEMPPLEGRIRLRYDDPRGRFWGEASGRFVARQTRVSEAFGELEAPGFSTFGLRTGASMGSNVSMSLGIENLFDRAYYEHLNRKQKLDMKPIMEPGRNVYLGVRLGF